MGIEDSKASTETRFAHQFQIKDTNIKLRL